MQKGGGRVMWIYNPLEFFELKNQDGYNVNLWKLLKYRKGEEKWER